MKTRMISLCAALLAVAGMVLNASDLPEPKPGSAEFQKMKTLVGTWKGKVEIGQGPVDMTAEYRILAGGTVLEERVFPGTPMEMVTMYYDKEGKLAMTHYCVMGNRPSMVLKSSDKKTIN